jgi:transcriptional regulator GlxA family with amidase domain
MAETPRRLGTLLFPDFELLDVCGPLEVLGVLRDHFDVVLVAEQAGPVRSFQGQALVADHDLDGCPPLDVLLVPGGLGTRREVENERLLAWLRESAQAASLVMTVCTGSGLLARSGALDGRRATSNKRAFDWAASQGPNVEWVRQARWVDDGKFVTSSGVSAGIDMMLHVVAREIGRDVAEEAAWRIEYTWHRDADDDPFVEPRP